MDEGGEKNRLGSPACDSVGQWKGEEAEEEERGSKRSEGIRVWTEGGRKKI